MCSLRVPASVLPVLLLLSCLPLSAQTATLKQQIESKYALTKATANRDDIVTAGDVIVLQKDKLLMFVTTNSTAPTNTYKNGKLEQRGIDLAVSKSFLGRPASVVSRTYVTGEKFWVTGLDVKDDGVVL